MSHTMFSPGCQVEDSQVISPIDVFLLFPGSKSMNSPL